jgi:hypothetical protein
MVSLYLKNMAVLVWDMQRARYASKKFRGIPLG